MNAGTQANDQIKKDHANPFLIKIVIQNEKKYSQNLIAVNFGIYFPFEYFRAVQLLFEW